MRKLHVFLINGIILTAVSLLIRVIMVWFNAYISNKIGAEGMGLYTLVMSVYTLAVTVAISGMTLACTRIVAEEEGIGNSYGIRYSVHTCAIFGFLCGTAAAAVVFIFADFIGTVLLQNEKTILSLRAFAVCLPFLSVSSILNGYFTSVGRIVKSSAVQFAELFTRIFVTALFLNLIFPKTMEFSCLSVVLGGTIAETMSCVYYSIIYIADSRRYRQSGSKKGIKKRILKIAIPVALSSYLKSGLSTIKHILIPLQLKKSGLSAEKALSQYGIIHGMVMPVIMFPSAIIMSFSSLILPEFSQLYVHNSSERIKSAISKTFKITLLFSIGVSAVFIYYSDFLGTWIYKSAEAGYYIRLIAPLTVIMYLDTVVDSILKGINQQVGVVKINIIDTVTCIILIYFLLPAYSTIGYIFVIFVSEILNGVLSVNMLIRSTEFELRFNDWILKPAIAACVTGFCIKYISIPNTFVSILVYIAVYAIFLSAFGCLNISGSQYYFRTPKLFRK